MVISRAALILGVAWSLAGCETVFTTPTPTRPPLVATITMDYPVVAMSLFVSQKYTQYANVTVYGANGQPVAGATVRGTYLTPYTQTSIIFPVTDALGQTRLSIQVGPPRLPRETHTITIYAVSTSVSSNSVTMFEVMP